MFLSAMAIDLNEDLIRFGCIVHDYSRMCFLSCDDIYESVADAVVFVIVWNFYL